jgi:hypothetical protein
VPTVSHTLQADCAIKGTKHFDENPADDPQNAMQMRRSGEFLFRTKHESKNSATSNFPG